MTFVCIIDYTNELIKYILIFIFVLYFVLEFQLHPSIIRINIGPESKVQFVYRFTVFHAPYVVVVCDRTVKCNWKEHRKNGKVENPEWEDTHSLTRIGRASPGIVHIATAYRHSRRHRRHRASYSESYTLSCDRPDRFGPSKLKRRASATGTRARVGNYGDAVKYHESY